MDSFTIYVFNSELRIDGKPEDFGLVVNSQAAFWSPSNRTTGSGTQLVYKASKVFKFNIDTEKFACIKNRNADTLGMDLNFRQIYNGNELFIYNPHLGISSAIHKYLYNIHTFSPGNQKMLKLSIDGMDRPEIYLSALFDRE